MLIVLPDKMDAVKDLENVFLKKSKNYAHLLNNMTIHNVELDVPKFKFESDMDLEKTMQKVSVKHIPGYMHVFTLHLMMRLVNINISFVRAINHLDGVVGGRRVLRFFFFYYLTHKLQTIFFLLQLTNRKIKSFYKCCLFR